MIKFLLIKKKNKGFSLIELLLVFVLIIGMTATVLKQIKKKTPTIHNLIEQISEVTQEVFLKSIFEGKPYQVRLFFEEGSLITHIGYGPYEREQAKIYNKKKIMNSFLIDNCIINDKDEMAIRSKEIWFNFFPDGYCQEVKFSIRAKQNEIKYNYILNPFNGIIESSL